MLTAHNIAVERKFDDLSKINVRSGEVIQVFSNMVSNAIDAMPQGGTLSILDCSNNETGWGWYSDHHW